MNRTKTFIFRVSLDERKTIAILAERLQRSQSDAVRFLVLNAARQLGELKQENSLSQPLSQEVGETHPTAA